MDDLDREHLARVLRHINHVRELCELMGNKLIEEKEEELGLEIIRRGQIHDNTKLRGLEFQYLRNDQIKLSPVFFDLAIKHHWAQWDHHPEFFGPKGIHLMSDPALGEMVCDWAARSSELGENINDWVAKVATTKYGFTLTQNTGKKVLRFLKYLFDGEM